MKTKLINTILGGSLLAVALVTTAFLAVSLPALAQQPSPAEPKVLSDGADAKFTRVETCTGRVTSRFSSPAATRRRGNIVAACFNAMFTPNGIPASKDTAPQKLIEGLDMDKLKTEYGVLNASLSGPKIWQPDWVTVNAGVERDFNGIPATWVAQLNMGDNLEGVAEMELYKPVTIARKSQLGWNKGTRVFLLDDPEGNSWILKGFQLGLKPQHTFEEFLAGGPDQFKKLAEDWFLRTKILKQDLIEKPANGVATIMPDEFFNVYDKTGPIIAVMLRPLHPARNFFRCAARTNALNFSGSLHNPFFRSAPAQTINTE